jgi:hypothetical protein
MKRLSVALGAIAVLMLLAWFTLDDQRFRLGALVILAMFAVRTWSHGRRQQSEQERQGREDE